LVPLVAGGYKGDKGGEAPGIAYMRMAGGTLNSKLGYIFLQPKTALNIVTKSLQEDIVFLVEMRILIGT
jgi:hypothetical protein